MPSITISLPSDLYVALTEKSKKTGDSVSKIIRDIVVEYYKNKGEVIIEEK